MPPNPKTIYNNFSETVYSKPSYIGTLEVLEYICFILILYWYNPFSISTTYPVFTNSLTLLVSLIYVVLFYFLSEKIALPNTGPTETGFLIKLLGTVGVFLGSVVLLKYLGGFIAEGRLGILTLLRYFIQGMILIVALAVMYSLLKPYFETAKARGKDNKTILAFFFNLLMFLPCLVLSLIDYVKNQYHITTKPVWLLLLAEVVLIVLWVLIPLGLHAFATKNGIQLLKAPQYINTEATLGTFAELHGAGAGAGAGTDTGTGTGTDTGADNTITKFNYHYALSFWFYLNPQPPNTSPAYNTFTNILTYGDKPAVQFNGALNTLRVLVESAPPGAEKKTVEIYKTKNVLYQKWNNMVINYDRGTMDVFLNGELVGSRPSIAPYMTYESIQVGSNNGLAGGISNVMYYKDNLTTF
jgi:hypothetical protein